MPRKRRGGSDGQEGEIRVKGIIVFNEYWGKPEATAETFDKDGYFKTGDIGVRDPEDADGFDCGTRERGRD